MLPNFLLIGPGRTGTTWSTKCLMLHPDIYMPRCKSTKFFSDNYDRGREWYESLFQGWSGERAVGEASVGYLPRAEAPARIHELIPDVKLIATVRHPVDRAYSSYGRLAAFAKKGDPNYGISFEQKIENTPRLINEGYYAEHLKRYLQYFPKEQILVLFHDDMQSDPKGFLREIYQFLGVDTEFEAPVLDQKINATSTLRARSRVLYGTYRAMMRLGLFNWTKRIDSLNGREPPKLSPGVRDKLIERYYENDILELERLTKRDLSEWKQATNRCVAAKGSIASS